MEECLLNALLKSELITQSEFVRPQIMHYQRAARTDKSVSAIRQIVSLKLPDTAPKRLEEINKFLPDEIRIMGCKQVTPAFDSKNFCDYRTYSYLMPSFALCPISEVTREDYRVPDSIIKLFNQTLEGYVGSHAFHNFTSGKKFSDDSSVRVIKFMTCSEPFFPCNQNDLEFVVIRVKGQSFMMHQIRKMIGLAIAVVKGFATEQHIEKSMQKPFMDVPKAPGLGLMLEEVHFDRYNRKFGCDGKHEPIEWNDCNEAVDEFKNKYIYPVVVDTEKEEKSMMNWLYTLSLHTYGAPDDSIRPEVFKRQKLSHEEDPSAAEQQEPKGADQVHDQNEQIVQH